MQAQDIMAINVVSVDPHSSVQEIAALLLKNRIGALPVIGQQGALIGIISEGDLMRRIQEQAKHRRSCGSRFLPAKAASRWWLITSSHMHAGPRT
jgi:CBS domain-containing protein